MKYYINIIIIIIIIANITTPCVTQPILNTDYSVTFIIHYTPLYATQVITSVLYVRG
jgi:hypothetical protein